MNRDRLGVAWAGLGLIGLGILLLLANWIGWDKIWPAFPTLAGLAFWGGYVASDRRDGGLAFVGTAGILVGLFFFGFTLGLWAWEEMGRLWPVFPIIGGLAFFVLFFAERRARDVSVLGVGLAAILVGLVGLGFTHGYVSGDIIKLWPLLLVLIGVVGLVGGLLQMARRA